MDCCFENDKKYFRYRAAAIIIENDCVLVIGNETSDYFYSIGGGVHLLETAEDAVIREVFEEAGVHYEIDRLLVIHENFFKGNGSTEGLLCHEVAFYYLMKSQGSQITYSNSYCPDGKENVHWIPISDLDKYKVFPTFYADVLKDIPSEVKHIVTNELDEKDA